MTIEQALF